MLNPCRKSGVNYIPVKKAVYKTDQEKILALLASWPFNQEPTAKYGNISIEKVLHIKKKGSKSSLRVLKYS